MFMDFEIIGEITHIEPRHSPTPYFAVCLNNEGYPASLEVGKLYRVIPDEEAAVHGYIRVIDESGEDYGYATERFYRVVLPHMIEQTLLFASEKVAA
jgi:hypothetical protein